MGRRGAPAPRPAARGRAPLAGRPARRWRRDAGGAGERGPRGAPAVLRGAGPRRPGHRRGSPRATGSPRPVRCWRWSAGTLARIGNEVYELQRPEIGELREPARPDLVGSITMPHKRNPERSEHLDTLGPAGPRPRRRAARRHGRRVTSATAAAGRPSGWHCPRSACSRRRRRRSPSNCSTAWRSTRPRCGATSTRGTGSEQVLAAADAAGSVSTPLRPRCRRRCATAGPPAGRWARRCDDAGLLGADARWCPTPASPARWSTSSWPRAAPPGPANREAPPSLPDAPGRGAPAGGGARAVAARCWSSATTSPGFAVAGNKARQLELLLDDAAGRRAPTCSSPAAPSRRTSCPRRPRPPPARGLRVRASCSRAPRSRRRRTRTSPPPSPGAPSSAGPATPTAPPSTPRCPRAAEPARRPGPAAVRRAAGRGQRRPARAAYRLAADELLAQLAPRRRTAGRRSSVARRLRRHPRRAGRRQRRARPALPRGRRVGEPAGPRRSPRRVLRPGAGGRGAPGRAAAGARRRVRWSTPGARPRPAERRGRPGRRARAAHRGPGARPRLHREGAGRAAAGRGRGTRRLLAHRRAARRRRRVARGPGQR